MKIRKKGTISFVAFKLDISKAYDRMEWSYLEAMMKKLGFGAKWITLIMECVTTVSFSVLVNGQPSSSSNIEPFRDLGQGDLLSPFLFIYLFLLCAEGLNTLIVQSEINGEIRGVQVTRGGTRITHFYLQVIVF